MKRFRTALKFDIIVQLRNQLYTIGISVAVLIAIVFSQLARPGQLPAIVPALMLLVIGGTTLLYVAAMIIFEKDEGTLNAVIVSPLRTSEYLWSKIISLTGLATLESVMMIGGAMLIMDYSEEVVLPNIPLLLLGIVTIGVIYTLIGIVLVAPYTKITDFLMPMAAVVSILQIPFLYFWGVIEHWVFLIIPTSAPAMLIRGAFVELAGWEWIYGIVYTTVLIVGLTIWAHRAFYKHMIMRVA